LPIKFLLYFLENFLKDLILFLSFSHISSSCLDIDKKITHKKITIKKIIGYKTNKENFILLKTKPITSKKEKAPKE
jgi:hypothetical protein